jgi:hypothetical protein
VKDNHKVRPERGCRNRSQRVLAPFRKSKKREGEKVITEDGDELFNTLDVRQRFALNVLLRPEI